MVTVHCNGLGLVHAGLRRYIFCDPSARGRIISHDFGLETRAPIHKKKNVKKNVKKIVKENVKKNVKSIVRKGGHF